MLPQWFQHHTITKMFYVISLTVMTQLSQGPGKVTSKCVKMVDLELKGFIIKLRKQKSKVSQIIKTGSATQTNKESKQKKSFLIFEGLFFHRREAGQRLQSANSLCVATLKPAWRKAAPLPPRPRAVALR